MADFLCISLSIAFIYCASLAGIEYARGKPKKVRRILICLIVVAFSICIGWATSLATSINSKRITIESVEKAWNEYTKYCKDENISWDEMTFPEWIAIEADIKMEIDSYHNEIKTCD